MPKKQIEQMLTSQEVAEMVGKEHGKLIRDIRRYSEHLTEAKIGFSEYWKEGTYKDITGRQLPSFSITKKGCEFIAHKMTGVKGTAFTAKYINRFHEMEETLAGASQTALSLHDNKELENLVWEQSEKLDLQAEKLDLQAEMIDSQKNMLVALTRVVLEMKDVMDTMSAIPKKEEKVRLKFSGEHVDESTMKSRAKRLNMFVGKLAKLSLSDKSDIYCSIYTEIEKRFEVSLDSFQEVLRAEYKSGIYSISVVAYWNDFYDYAFNMLENALSRYSTFSKGDLL